MRKCLSFSVIGCMHFRSFPTTLYFGVEVIRIFIKLNSGPLFNYHEGPTLDFEKLYNRHQYIMLNVHVNSIFIIV